MKVRALAASSRAPLPEKTRLPTVMLNSAESLLFLSAMSRFDFGQVLLCFGDVTGKVANLPSDVALLVCMNGTQLVELADLSVDLDFLDDGRIAGRNRLDLGVRESATVEVLRRPDRCFTAHHLMDKAGLGFERLPHVRIEGALRHIAVDLHLFVRVALAQYPPFTLLDVARAPWRIEVMKRDEPSLNVGAGAHLFGGAEQYPNSDPHSPHRTAFSWRCRSPRHG